jgi:prepilin-type N-terminal cleavage/methylation domain-containing protein
MLSKFRKSEEGFTLIELLIVVAIIGILAAIAIPQFSAYRIRAFNGAGSSDLKNARTAQEALFTDFQTYGKSESNILLGDATVASGPGVIAFGPMAQSSPTVSGLAFTGSRNGDNQPVGVGCGLSNGVGMNAFTLGGGAAPSWGSTSYMITVKHTQGTRVFATETEGTGMWFVEDSTWAGTVLGAGGAPATVPANLVGTAEIDATVDGGGVPLPNWAAL